MSAMIKKNTKNKKTVYRQKDEISKVEEPIAVYRVARAAPALKDFTYNEFKKISDKAPFTQAEWAGMLHVSERTLQRYAKSNGVFASINAERALQIANVLKEGKITFGSIDKFYSWLKTNPYMLEGNLSLESLTSAEGINKILTQLGRIQHGLFA
jgi:putative toxin-antitoxin system antitoxin component (TIGR02293 family)